MFNKCSCVVSLGRVERALRRLELLGLLNLKIGVLNMALSDEVKVFAEAAAVKIDAAVADIQALHAIIAGALDQGDVPGAQAALASLNSKLDALQAAVDIPE